MAPFAILSRTRKNLTKAETVLVQPQAICQRNLTSLWAPIADGLGNKTRFVAIAMSISQ